MLFFQDTSSLRNNISSIMPPISNNARCDRLLSQKFHFLIFLLISNFKISDYARLFKIIKDF